MTTPMSSSQASGKLAEDQALRYLQRHGLKLVARNFRCKGGEIDLILSQPAASKGEQELLVFVEVRQRRSQRFGGAAASVTSAKQSRLILAAQVFLQRYPQPPACRFDVLAMDADNIDWIRQAFEA
ncbi:YraN family protein [Collimonas pratensis]|nr:YraN family protein [Collimonas pratensis]